MADQLAKDIIKMHGIMKAERSNFDSLYQEIAQKVAPEYGGFTDKNYQDKRPDRSLLFDSTAPSALEKLASALDDMLTPRNARWHKLETNDKKINDDRDFKIWASEVVDILFASRYSPRSNFASQIHECYKGLGGFGTTSLFVDKTKEGYLRYRSEHLAGVWIRENMHGYIDYAHREIEYTAEQAIDAFTKEALPEEIIIAQEKSPARKFTFVHCIKPNPEYDPMSKRTDRMKYKSVYISITGEKVVQEGGYRTFRMPTSRYTTMPRQLYGSSPAIRVLPDIKTLNEMEKTILQQGQKSVNPVLLAAKDILLSQFALIPGSINYGAIGERGDQLVKEMPTGANFPLGLELSDRRREIINDAFLVNLFQILVETPTMTATEVLERAKEKGMLLAPTGGRQQSELLGGIIECEIDILDQMGKLPPKPQILIDSGADVSVLYTSPLNQAQRAGEGLAIQRTLESVTPLAQTKPEVLDRFNFDKITKELADINGLKAELMFSDDEMAEMNAQKAQSAEAEQLLNAAPVVANSAKAFAETQALAQTPSNQPLPNILPQ